MNEKQKRQYRARMAVAQLFRAILSQDGERARLMNNLGVEAMPVIVPALGDTLASNVRKAAKRYLENGEDKVVVPVCTASKNSNPLKLTVLVISNQGSKGFWSLNMDELHDNVTMVQVIEALDSTKKWDIGELDSQQQQEFKDLASLV